LPNIILIADAWNWAPNREETVEYDRSCPVNAKEI
jgi:hypothetical protein